VWKCIIVTDSSVSEIKKIKSEIYMNHSLKMVGYLVVQPSNFASLIFTDYTFCYCVTPSSMLKAENPSLLSVTFG
jgi:hypothetical protein